MKRNVYTPPPMTDVEYYKLALLFETKRLTMADLESLELWVIRYGTSSGYSEPRDVIETLESYPDR